MKYIEKKAPIAEFTNFIKHAKPSVWADIPTDIKTKCRKHILQTEQCNQSAYTEKYIAMDSQNIHLDHFKKRDLFPSNTFDWNNLLVDETDDRYGARYKDKCVKTKSDYNTIFNPVEDNVENYFDYSYTGTIAPKPNLTKALREKTEKTIKTFYLNHPSLVGQRHNILIALATYNDLPDEDILDILHNFGFSSLIKQFLLERKKHPNV